MARRGHNIFCLVSDERSGQRATQEEGDQSPFSILPLCYSLLKHPPQWWHTCQSCRVWVVTCSSPAFMGLFTTCDSFTRKTKSRDKSGLCSITQSWQPSIQDYFTCILWNTLHCNYMTSRCCIALHDLWPNVKKKKQTNPKPLPLKPYKCAAGESISRAAGSFSLFDRYISSTRQTVRWKNAHSRNLGGDKTGILTVIYANKDAHPCYTLWNQDGRCVGKCTKWPHLYQC